MALRWHLFGDSHTLSIDHPDMVRHEYRAGSAMGMNNPQSVSQYHSRFIKERNDVPEKEPIVLKFGQVDADFVYYMKLAKQSDLRFDEFAKDSVSKYTHFIKHYVLPRKVTVLSIYPPFVSEQHHRYSLCNLNTFTDRKFFLEFRSALLRMKIPSLKERVEYNTCYNHYLRRMCAELNIPFIDVFTPLMDTVTSLPKYINPNYDHHLCEEEGKRLVSEVVSRSLSL